MPTLYKIPNIIIKTLIVPNPFSFFPAHPNSKSRLLGSESFVENCETMFDCILQPKKGREKTKE